MRARSGSCCSTSLFRLSTRRPGGSPPACRGDLPVNKDAAGILVTHDLAEAQAFGGQLGSSTAEGYCNWGEHTKWCSPPSLAAWRAGRLWRLCPVPSDVRTGGSRSIPTGSCSGAAARTWRRAQRDHRGDAPVRSSLRMHGRARRSGEPFTIHVDQPPAAGTECTLTALDPPVVAPDTNMG